MRLLKLVFSVCLVFITLEGNAQRGRNSNIHLMDNVELAQKRYEDSMKRVRDSFAQNFNIKQYFAEQKKLREAQERNQLDESVKMLNSLIAVADTLTSLTIQASQMKELPESIRSFRNLKSLTLRRCRDLSLEDVVTKLKELKSLEVLEIIFSEKRNLPETLGELRQIKTLNLNGNKISTLPASMSNMALIEINLYNNTPIQQNQAFEVLSKIKSLKRVNMGGCRIEDLGDNFGRMTQIEEIDLKTNDIAKLPSNIEQMISLKRINLSNNMKLDPLTIFYELSKIPHLEKATLNNINLTEVPASIGILKQIRILEFQENPIVKISSEIGSLENLEELHVGTRSSIFKCGLKTLPSELSKCTKLKILDLKMSDIETLPASFSALENLEYIDLSWNKLLKFPDFLAKLSKVRHLDVSRNAIGAFPTQLGVLGTSLETLLFEGNFYGKYTEKLNRIPLSITTLTNLKKLSLKDQVFENLPNNFWTSLINLEELNLSGGLIQEIPDGIESLTKLKTLYLKGNEIKILNPKLVNMKSLENLDVSSNLNFDTEASLETIKQLTKLKTLDISYNDIKKQAGREIKMALPNVKIEKREMSDSPEHEKDRSNKQ
jgi:Leucine-rich repeat (LRR) protein